MNTLCAQTSDEQGVNASQTDTIAPADDLGLEYPVDYKAEDSTVVDVLNEQILLYGKAIVTYGSMEVTGDFITFSTLIIIFS